MVIKMKKPIFDLQTYTEKLMFMRCFTEEEANVFCNFLHENGRCWCNKESYKNNACFETFGKETCYEFNQGKYGDFRSIKDNYGACFLEFDSFDWSKYGYIDIADVATGDEINAFLNGFSVYT